MAVTLKFKYIVLIVLHLFNIGRSKLIHNTGKEFLIANASAPQKNTVLHWPKGIVTYYLDEFSYDSYIAERVLLAMNTLESASCVRFKPTLTKPPGKMTWINITNPHGERNCAHEPRFKNDGEIVLVLGFDCLKQHEILHTLLHAIGFKDEVSHPQRDQYIRVMWNNIQPEYQHLYRMRSGDEKTSQLLVEYDPLSIMHFHDRAFSMNGQATIMPLIPGLLISPSDELSQLDKMRLRLQFDHECNKRKVGDIIDTCKMMLSGNATPNNSMKITDSKEENQVASNAVNEKEKDGEYEGNKDTSANVDKGDQGDDDKAGKDDEVDTDHKIDNVGEGDEVNKVDDFVEVDIQDKLDGNKSNSKEPIKLHSIENNYDLNERNPDTLKKAKKLQWNAYAEPYNEDDAQEIENYNGY